jgi:hypothetical protein
MQKLASPTIDSERQAQPQGQAHAPQLGQSSFPTYWGNQAALRRLSPIVPRIQTKLEIGATNDPLDAEADQVANRVMRSVDDSEASDIEANLPSPNAKDDEQVQAKLEVGATNDPLEVEADHVAERVMRSVDDEEASDIEADLPSPGAKDDEQVQTKSEAGNAATQMAPPIVHSALRGPGSPLDAATRGFFEARFNRNFAGVRIHTDNLSAASARAIGAKAYTLGNRIVFSSGRFAPATPQGRLLLAHELAHVVQQGSAIRRDDEENAGGDTPGKQVIDALSAKDPVGGVGDTGRAFGILKGLASTDELIAALLEVDKAALIDVLVSALAPGDQSELASAICAVRFTSSVGQADDQFGVRAAQGIAQLARPEQDKLIGMVLQRRGSTATVQEVREGVDALMESESTRQAQPEVDADTPTSMMAGIMMGPWNPGNMPIGYYIGNSAHVAIAAAYAALHVADAAFYNFTPVSAILQAAAALGIKISPAAATAAQLGLKPDIANITKAQLYEIKPVRLQSLALTELALYLAAFAAAGVPMLPGPVGEPGTFGTLPAPGGWFVYSSPEPGVITYAYRQPPRKKPANDNATQPVTAPDNKTLVERISILTGLTGIPLMIYLIISEGSRVVIPPRNALPIP